MTRDDGPGQSAAQDRRTTAGRSAELPRTAAVRRAFLVTATYAAEAAELRKPVRALHLDRIRQLIDDGTLVLAGAFSDLSASVMVATVASAAEAEAIAAADPYVEAGVWIAIDVREFDLVVVTG